MKQLTRMIACLLVVATAYWLYALLAVPLIEPQANFADGDAQRSNGSRRSANDSDYLRHIAHVFTPSSWELDGVKTKVLETNRGLILFQDYAPQPDGLVRVTPFTVVYFAGQASSPGGMPGHGGRPIVMRAPEGALLEFDPPLDLENAEIGHLVGASLLGEIRIQSPESSPGANDPLLIVTRSIEIDEELVYTQHDVKFWYGRHYGSGHEMIIHLTSKSPAAIAPQRGLSARTVDSLKLVHVDRVHLHLTAVDKASGQRHPRTVETPVEIKCRGPFQFDFDEYRASFQQDVDVTRLHPSGLADQLTCDALNICFRQRQAGAEEAPHDRSTTSLQIHRFVATGRPATLHAPTEQASARGEHLEYDMIARRVFVRDPVQAMIAHGVYQIQAPWIDYTFGPEGRLGELKTGGPGRLTGVAGQRAEEFAVNWQRELLLQPENGQPVATLREAASVSLEQTGRIAANQMRLWLTETQHDVSGRGSTKTRFTIEPKKMLATDNVTIDSPQLTGESRKMEVWFDNVAQSPPTQPVPETELESAREDAPAVHQQYGVNAREALFREKPSSAVEHPPASAPPPRNQFHVTGDQIQILVRRDGTRSSVEDVTVLDNVHLIETKTARPDELPLDLTGDTLKLFPGERDAANAVAHLTGRRAVVAVRGMTLASTNIHLDQAANQVWIDGPGEMTLAAKRDANGQWTSGAGETTITWQERMKFNGSEARFNEQVQVRGRQLQQDGNVRHIAADGPAMLASLTRPVEFRRSAQPAGAKPELRKLIFDRGVHMTNHTVDPRGTLVAVEEMEAPDLLIDQVTGELRAGGEGWASTVRRNGAELSRQTQPTNAPASDTVSNPQRLTYVRIDYRGSVDGNLHKRIVTFRDVKRAVYGPVADWNHKLDPDRRGGLGPDGMKLTCRDLTIAEMGPRVGERGAVEMIAEENVVIEGREFQARGHRLSYDERKDLVTLHGDERRDAEIRRQAQPGGRPDEAAARTIKYSRRNGTIQVENGQVLDLSHFQFGTPRPASPPPR